MLNRKNWMVGALVVLLALSGLTAQEKLVLTLDGSVELAFKNNPGYQIALKEVRKAKASAIESYSNVMPQINASANLQHTWEIQETIIPNFIKPALGPGFPGYDQMPDYLKLSFGLENTLVFGASLTQPLYLGGAGYAGIRIAGAAERAARQNLETSRQNLLYQTAGAFYGCLVAKEVVKVQEEALQQSEENLDMVRKKYDAGAASKFDFMRAEVNVANTKPAAITARNQYKTALTRLKMVLALPIATEIEVDGELLYELDDFTNQTVADYQQMALRQRPEMLATLQHKAIARRGVTIARSNFMPKAFFSTDLSFLGMKNDLGAYTLREMNDFSRGFTSSISVQMPLFTSGKNATQYQKSQLDYRMMLDTEKQVEDGIAAEVEAVYNTFQEANEKYQAASENVHLAEETFRLATMMYNEGTNTQLDVFTAQLGLTSARLNYLSSLYEYQLTRYALRKVTGTLKDTI